MNRARNLAEIKQVRNVAEQIRRPPSDNLPDVLNGTHRTLLGPWTGTELMPEPKAERTTSNGMCTEA